jgi:acyl-lipid omega-6 desaturase (Delta-12 desaturase)
METTVKGVRAALPAGSRDRSTATGLAFFAIAAIVYAGSFVATALPSSWIVRLLVALANGLAIGVVFIVGHDACHGSLTPSSFLNEWLGRLAFLPALHPLSAWEYSHNTLHHGWTNLRGKDPVYCPRTLEEFRALSPARQRAERLYRSWLGLLPLYLVTIWWRLEMTPSAEHRARIDRRGSFRFDRGVVIAVPFVQAASVAALRARVNEPWWALAGAMAVSVVLPFLTFTWLIGFATFQHHTHPRVLWYRDEAEWNFFRAQVQGTVHVEFPRWIERLLNNIMEHTAHHVDPKVPLYRLTKAQDALEAVYGTEDIVREQFSFAGMSATFRACQLYDFDEHRWLSFDGTPTTAARYLADEASAGALATPAEV